MPQDDLLFSDDEIDTNETKLSINKTPWLYYTRSPLMDTYRDNLYRDNYSISALIAIRGSKNDMSIGISLKILNNEIKKELRVIDIENFLFSVIIGSSQVIETEEFKLELEDFSKEDSKLIRFLNMIFQEGDQKLENGKLWFKDYSLYNLLEILKNIESIRFESRVITFSDEVLKVKIIGENTENDNIILKATFIDDIDIERIHTFGLNCPYILYKDIFYMTTPSYPKMIKTLFRDDIIINKDYINDFCIRVLPNLKKDFDVEMPQGIKESEEKAFPVEPLVYLDYDGEYVFAAIKFKYGRFTIDPYSNKLTSTDLLNLEDSVYRDYEKEDFYCDKLSNILEKVGDYTFSTKDDKKIFYLCYKTLPLLQDKGWTFYYSETFRTLKINVAPKRMQVSITKDINFFEINFSFDGVQEIHDLSDLIKQVKVENKCWY